MSLQAFGEAFHFLRPAWLLALVPMALLLATLGLARRRNSAWRRIVDEHLLAALLITRRGGAQRWPLALLAVGWLGAALAMAGPTWKRLPQPTYSVLQPTVIALDLSRAMDSEDLAPSRVARARYKIHDILDRLQGGQVGLVLFTDEPYVASPLTDDARVIEEMLPTLATDLMPTEGQRTDRAIAQAAALLEQAGAPVGHIVVITHGVEGDADALHEEIERAAGRGFHVSILAAGTEEGAPLRDHRGRLVSDASGRPVLSRVDRDALERLAQAGGGAFALLSADDSDVERVLSGAPGPPVAGERRESEIAADVWQDAGAWLVPVLVVLGALAFRRGWVVVVVLAFAGLAGTPRAEAGVWDDMWTRPDRRAAIAFEEGRSAEAAQTFRRPDWKGAALYTDGRYEEAVEALGGATALEGQAAVENTYNLGNALARAGRLEEALAAYDDVLEAQRDHADALFNRDLVKKLLEQQQQERQEQQKEQEQQEQPGQCDRPNPDTRDGGESGESGSSKQEEAAASSPQDGSSEQESSTPGQEPDSQPRDASGSDTGSPSTASQDRDRRGRGVQEPPGDEAGRRPETRPTGTHGPSRPSPARDVPRAPDMTSENEGAIEEPGSDTVAALDSTRPMTEEEQAEEQTLRLIPQDPGGLLRAKILRRYMEKRYGNE